MTQFTFDLLIRSIKLSNHINSSLQRGTELGKSSEVIYAFIDSQNLNLTVKRDIYNKKTGILLYKGWKLDFKKFYVYLQDKYNVSKALLFIGKVNGNEILYKSLRNYGYKLIFKPTMEYIDDDGVPHTKGNVDAELILHAMIELPNYDKAVIVAGDGDYHCLIEHLASIGKLNHLLIPNKVRFSSLLTDFIGYTNYVSELKTKLEYKDS